MEEWSAKLMAYTLQKAYVTVEQQKIRLRNWSWLKESKETWKLNTKYNSGLDPAWEKNCNKEYGWTID